MTFRQVLTLILFTLLAPWAQAVEVPRYQFEIIIFEYTNQQNTETETWSEETVNPDNENALFLITGSPTDKAGSSVITAQTNEPITYQPLNPEQLILNKEAKAIKRSSSRKLLLHTGWIQNMQSMEQAIPVAIKIGKEYTSLVPDTAEKESTIKDLSIGASEPSGFTGSDYETAAATPALVAVKYRQLEGTIKISISRYLHIWTDLIYRRPVSNPAFIGTNTAYTDLRAFRYQDHRRMRSKELHYIDNPSFGILIYALPVNPAHEGNQPAGK